MFSGTTIMFKLYIWFSSSHILKTDFSWVFFDTNFKFDIYFNSPLVEEKCEILKL